MSEKNLFELAARKKFRFEAGGYNLSTEDLFDIPLDSTRSKQVSLETVAQAVNVELEAAGTQSFTKRRRPTATLANDKMELVKQIIEIRLAEVEAKEEAAAKATKKKRLEELLAQKELEKDAELSVEELKEQLAALG